MQAAKAAEAAAWAAAEAVRQVIAALAAIGDEEIRLSLVTDVKRQEVEENMAEQSDKELFGAERLWFNRGVDMGKAWRDLREELLGAREKPDWLSEVQRLELNPGDAIVVKADVYLGPENATIIERDVAARFPGHEVMILAPEFDLGVIGRDAAKKRTQYRNVLVDVWADLEHGVSRTLIIERIAQALETDVRPMAYIDAHEDEAGGSDDSE